MVRGPALGQQVLGVVGECQGDYLQYTYLGDYLQYTYQADYLHYTYLGDHLLY